jgi:hypothetical protein
MAARRLIPITERQIMIEFYWPVSNGEWMAFSSAAVTVFFGALSLVFPRWTLNLLRLRTQADFPQAVSEMRATLAGFYLGLGGAAILLAQPFIYLALGAAWVMTAFGRLVSVVLDRGFNTYNVVSIMVESVLAGLALVYALGYVA